MSDLVEFDPCPNCGRPLLWKREPPEIGEEVLYCTCGFED